MARKKVKQQERRAWRCGYSKRCAVPNRFDLRDRLCLPPVVMTPVLLFDRARQCHGLRRRGRVVRSVAEADHDVAVRANVFRRSVRSDRCHILARVTITREAHRMTRVKHATAIAALITLLRYVTKTSAPIEAKVR